MFLKTLQCVNSNRTLVLNASVYTIIQVKLDKIINMLAKKFLLDGCDRITTQYTDMMKRKNNLTEWANDLHSYWFLPRELGRLQEAECQILSYTCI